VGDSPFGVTIAAGTVYAWNSDGTASLINAATCNAVERASCHKAKPTVTTGAGDEGLGDSNPRTHTVYRANPGDDTVSAFDSAACNAHHTAGCLAVAPRSCPALIRKWSCPTR
jgi:hypothetical protein